MLPLSSHIIHIHPSLVCYVKLLRMVLTCRACRVSEFHEQAAAAMADLAAAVQQGLAQQQQVSGDMGVTAAPAAAVAAAAAAMADLAAALQQGLAKQQVGSQVQCINGQSSSSSSSCSHSYQSSRVPQSLPAAKLLGASSCTCSAIKQHCMLNPVLRPVLNAHCNWTSAV
jgi:hypothetical protein